MNQKGFNKKGQCTRCLKFKALHRKDGMFVCSKCAKQPSK